MFDALGPGGLLDSYQNLRLSQTLTLSSAAQLQAVQVRTQKKKK